MSMTNFRFLMPTTTASRVFDRGDVTTLDVLVMAREWIDNLVRAYGVSVLNYTPDDTGGQTWLNMAIERMQEE